MTKPMAAPPRGRTGEATRHALMAAARELFGRKGFDGTSVRAITERAGANLGSITYHFGSKRALYAAVLDDGLSPLADRVVAVAGSDGTAAERMSAIVEAYFDHFREQPDIPHLLLQEVAAGKPPPPAVVDILHRVMGTLTKLHGEGVEDGSVRPGHPRLTALSVVAQPVFMTLVAPMLATVGGLDLFDPETRAEAVEHAARFVEAGLRPDETETSPPRRPDATTR
ncbi:MAG: TetR/AcrR family transcriptional regulator [Gemmatimonadota bacterium]|nr:TetR/AcrR family transcriptional regulator [Gemmatimonadota bacterium]